jgi:hypothetical protein
MDGTLLRRGKEISAETRRSLAEAADRGIHIILATGRPYRDALPYAEDLGLQMPMVINNGSEIWESPARLHSRHELPAKEVCRLLDLAARFGRDVRYWAHTVSGRVDETNLPRDPASLQWLQFGIHASRREVLAEIFEETKSWGAFEISNSHPLNIEFNAPGISKASGLEEVCQILHVPMDETVAVGDSLNDLAMIARAGFGVAMGNAQEEVKRAADWIAPTNEEDGVAEVIRRYLLGEDKMYK